jgi:hypothetical protein
VIIDRDRNDTAMGRAGARDGRGSPASQAALSGPSRLA